MTKTAVKTISGKDRPKLYRAIMRGEEFKTYGSFRGLSWDNHIGTGRLPSSFVGMFYDDQPDYVVYSYATPIAWHVPARDAGLSGDETTDERWVMPPFRYSVTTTKYQGIVRTALSFALGEFPWPYDDD